MGNNVYNVSCVTSPNLSFLWIFNGELLNRTDLGSRLKIIQIMDKYDELGNKIHNILILVRAFSDSAYSFQMETMFNGIRYLTTSIDIKPPNHPLMDDTHVSKFNISVGNCTNELWMNVHDSIRSISCVTKPFLQYDWILNGNPLSPTFNDRRYEIIYTPDTYDEFGNKIYNLIIILKEFDNFKYLFQMETSIHQSQYLTDSTLIRAQKIIKNELLVHCVMPYANWTNLTSKCTPRNPNTESNDKLSLNSVVNRTEKYTCDETTFTGINLQINPTDTLYNFTTGENNVRIIKIFENMRRGIFDIRSRLC
jgi:hypothetical protein